MRDELNRILTGTQMVITMARHFAASLALSTSHNEENHCPSWQKEVSTCRLRTLTTRMKNRR